MKRFRVKYYHLSSGMEGIADENDYGIIFAETAEDAKHKIARFSETKKGYEWDMFYLKAEEVV